MSSLVLSLYIRSCHTEVVRKVVKFTYIFIGQISVAQCLGGNNVHIIIITNSNVTRLNLSGPQTIINIGGLYGFIHCINTGYFCNNILDGYIFNRQIQNVFGE
jgi:hypothetical protein